MRFAAVAVLAALAVLSLSAARSQDLPQGQSGAQSRPDIICGTPSTDPLLPLARPTPPQCRPLGRILSPGYDIDAFRSLIRHFDHKAVSAVLQTAWADDQAEAKDFWRIRTLYFAFTDLDPATDQFSRDWLAAEPDNPLAQTARGTQLVSRMWAWRGQEYIGQTWPDRLTHVNRLQQQAMGLMQNALATKPDFLPAAEGLIQMDVMRGDQADLTLVLEAAMQAHPNLQTLRMAMSTLAPQWGGTQDQADLFCDHYAPMITVAPPYDAATCKIDVAFSAPYNGGPRMIAAQDALPGNASPWLDYARAKLAMAPWEPAERRLDTLTRIHAKRPFEPDEAQAWDTLNAGHGLAPEYPAALTRAVAQLRHWADNSPESPEAFLTLVALMQQDLLANQAPLPAAEILARAWRVLGAFPQTPGVWLMGAQIQVDPGVMPGQPLLDRLRAAEPWYINAMVYSGYQEGMVSAAVDPKLKLLNDDDYINASGPVRPEDLPPGIMSTLDRDLNCPTIRQLAILTRVCVASGRLDQGCGGWEAGTATTMGLTDGLLKGHCTAELHPQDDRDLAYDPIPLDAIPPPDGGDRVN